MNNQHSLTEPDYSGFEEYLKQRPKPGRDITIKEHLKRLREVYDTICEFNLEEIKRFFKSRKNLGTSNDTLRNFVSTVRLYARFLELTNGLEKYPLNEFPRAKGIVRRTLSDEQIEKLLAVGHYQGMDNKRQDMYKVFWSIIAFTALRPGECSKLCKNDIDLANKQIILRPEITKTNQFSTLPLFTNILPIIEDYLKTLKTDLLFPSYKDPNKPLSQVSWGENFHSRLQKAGIEQVPGLVPYSLRHSAATRWISNDMNFYKVRRLMRHAKMEQTLVYEHMTSGHLVASVLRHDPLVRKFAGAYSYLKSFQDMVDEYGVYEDQRISENFKKSMRDLILDELRRLQNLNLP